jgi:hypothetical protein
MTPDDPRAEHPQDPADARAELDELASALIDGELDPTAAVSARQRPEVLARVAELTAVRAALRESARAAETGDEGPDPAARERAVAAALAAFDDEGRQGDTAVSRFDVKRAARREATRRWLGAAAAVAVIGAGIAGLALAGSGGDSDDGAATEQATGQADAGTEESGGSDQTTTSGGDPESDRSSEATAAEGGASDHAGEEPSATGGDAVVDLGAFDTEAALVADVETRLGTDESGGGAGAAAEPVDPATLVARCPGTVPAPLADTTATVVFRGRATVAGTAIDVWVTDGEGGRRLVAIDAGCAVVVDRAVS